MDTIQMYGMQLSPKQKDVLLFIENTLAQTGRSPTYREIAANFGYESVATVQDHIAALRRKGFLKKGEGARSFMPHHREQGVLQVPLLGAVPAGLPIEAIEDVQGVVAISPQGKGWQNDEFFALHVKGDSMIEAGILDGDTIVVRRQETAEEGEIVVALLNGEVTVKRLQRRKGNFCLLPENPKYKPIEISFSDRFSIQGKVVSVQRFY